MISNKHSIVHIFTTILNDFVNNFVVKNKHIAQLWPNHYPT